VSSSKSSPLDPMGMLEPLTTASIRLVILTVAHAGCPAMFYE
jgi:hypothetical protein